MKKRANQRIWVSLIAITGALLCSSCSDDSTGGSKSGCKQTGCNEGYECSEDNVCVEKDKDPCADKVCGEGQTCEKGECVGGTTQGCEVTGCGIGLVCENGECVPDDPCEGKCVDGESCLNASCVEAACVVDGKLLNCDEDEACFEGGCVDRACLVDGQIMDCGDGKSCVDGACLEDACIINGNAKICPDKQSCLSGDCVDTACIENGQLKACDENQMCVAGECVDDGCIIDGVAKECQTGYQCVKGECEESACIGVLCGEGQSCTGGDCVDNECLEVACDSGSVCVKGDCILEACVDVEACPQGKVCVVDGSCQFETAPELSVIVPEGAVTDENGKTADIHVNLNHEPAAPVSLVCQIESTSPNIEASVDCSALKFDADNWQDTLTVVVTGVGDNIIDGDQDYTLSITTSSEDPEFDGLTLPAISLVNIDVDKAEIVIGMDGQSVMTSEGGDTASLTVSLSSKPTSSVTVTVASDRISEGVVAPTTLTFTPDNWNVPQTVTVTGVDDKVQDGTQEYHVVFDTASEDSNYNSLTHSIAAYNADDDKAGLSVMTSSIETDETGKAALIPVRLDASPVSDVVVTITINDATEAASATTTLTFTPDNYNVIQNVTITGLEDNIIDGDQKYTVTFTASSADNNYNTLDPVIVNGVNKDMDTAAVRVVINAAPVVSEDGTSIDMDLTLSAKPEKDVLLSLSVSDATELAVSTKSITFTPDNWNVAQTIKVSGVDDNIIDGDIVSNVIITSASEDGHFDKLSSETSFTTKDNDSAAIVVTSASDSLAENGGTASFTVKLTAIPESEVTISLQSSDITELAVDKPTSLTFNATNWNVAQTVNLKAVDDHIADGTQTAYIKLKSSSSDAHFNALEAQTAVYSILDDETVSVTLTLDADKLTPKALSTALKVSLSTEPAETVTVTVKSTNDITASLDKSTFVFTTANWDTPQSATVTNTNPMAAAAAITTEQFKGSASSTGVYNGVKTNAADITIYAFESQDFTYTGDVEMIALLPGKYKLEVWGAQGKGGGWTGGVNYAGKGGYSYGSVTLAKKTELSVCVGNNVYHAATDMGGYNGGGYGHGRSGNASQGGGATHIATTNRGILKNYADYQSEVLLVAGGGGGLEWDGLGGYGGGETGGAGSDASHGSDYLKFVVGAEGATQTAAGKSNAYPSGTSVMTAGGFGFGGYGYRSDVSYNDYGAGGGGGWYGGGGTSYAGAAGGGSGHIGAGVTGSTIAGNSVFAAPTGGNETGHEGAGYARITLVE